MSSLPRITFKFSSHPPAHTMTGSNVIQYSLLIRRKHTIYFLPALAAEHGFQYLHYFHVLLNIKVSKYIQIQEKELSLYPYFIRFSQIGSFFFFMTVHFKKIHSLLHCRIRIVIFR